MKTTTIILIVVILTALFLTAVDNAGGATTITQPVDSNACYDEWQNTVAPHWPQLSVTERANIAFQSILDCEK